MAASGSGCTASMSLTASAQAAIVKLVSVRNNSNFLSYENKRTMPGAGDDAGGLGSEAWHSAFVAVAGYQQEPSECGVPGADCGCATCERG